MTDVRSLLRGPIVVAPMAGGPTTAALVTAATEAGALAFIAGGYKSAASVSAEIAAVRDATAEAFGVNLFVPGSPTAERARTESYLASLDEDARSLGAELGDPAWDDDDWSAKIDALLQDPPPLVSFTFGCPDREIVSSLQDAGTQVVVTVTDPHEAQLAATKGIDGLCVQGIEAGAHRGSFANSGPVGNGLGVVDLVREIASITDLPLIGAGGVSDARDVAEVLHAGAAAVQCGTAFLRCPESGAHSAYKDALVDPRFTVTDFTRSFSGRPARGLVNRFMLNHADAPPAYPEINNATRPLRAAAASVGDVDRMSLWAGTGFKQASALPAADVVDRLDPRRS